MRGNVMKRAVLLSLLALGACASEPPIASPPPVTPAQAPGGEWIVAEDYAAEAVGVPQSPYKGQPVVLEADRAVDPAGHLCKTPAYGLSEGVPATILGNPPQPQSAQDPTPRPVLTITCAGEPFLTLVGQADGSWLTRGNSWVLRVTKAEPKSAEPMPLAAAPAPEPTPAPAQVEEAKAPAKPDARVLVYLASYKTEKGALAGYKVLAKASPILAAGQPVTRNVDLGKKGAWVRLYGMAADEAERTILCKQVGKHVDECGARNRE